MILIRRGPGYGHCLFYAYLCRTNLKRMIDIGKFNVLRACKGASQGMYLCDEEGNEVLLPAREEPADLLVDDKLEVFVYRDSEDRIVATLLKPKIIRDSFAWLQVKELTKFGAFLDWGLAKDLLVPFSEQGRKMVKDKWYLVYMYLDEKSDRLVATTRFDRFLQEPPAGLKEGDEVDLIVVNATDLGVNVIINQRFRGLVFRNDLTKALEPGERLRGYVKNIKPDGKIDVGLQRPGYGKVPPSADRILDALRQGGGFLPLTDKSDPQEIQRHMEMSKKTFKKAIGALYKQRLISIDDDGIRLVL